MKIVEQKLACKSCGGALEILKAYLDFDSCVYAISCACILCGEENMFALGLDDFVQLNTQYFSKKEGKTFFQYEQIKPIEFRGLHTAGLIGLIKYLADEDIIEWYVKIKKRGEP